MQNRERYSLSYDIDKNDYEIFEYACKNNINTNKGISPEIM